MTRERWYKFSKREQLSAIFAELERACVWQGKNEENFKSALERGLELADLSIDDPKWKGETFTLFVLRNEISKFYIHERTGSIQKLASVL